jgi:hypothetical protein
MFKLIKSVFYLAAMVIFVGCNNQDQEINQGDQPETENPTAIEAEYQALDQNEATSLARNSQDSEELAALARDERIIVLTAVAKNPNTSIETLEFLEKKATDLSADEDTPATEQYDQGEIVIANLLANPNLPPRYFEKYLTHENKRLRWVIALNPAISSEQMQKLTEDSELQVLTKLAANPSLDLEAMRSLIDLNKSTVILALLKRPDLPAAIIEELKASENEQISSKAENYNNQ